MGDRDGYAPGTFCWVDLGTFDPVAAKAFYMGLFGWEADDLPVGDGSVYTMFSLGGRHVCALYGRDAGQGPPAWLSYISVDDVDAIAARAGEAGARSVGDPFDVFDSGRMALLEDPTGAHVALWMPRNHLGAGVVNVPGALCLNQLNTSDPDRAAAFYTDLLGWRFQYVGSDEQPYWGIFNGPGLNGGMMPLPPGAEATSHWLAYFATDGVDAPAARVGELGGRMLVPPTPVPTGRIAVASDPQGAAFALLEGRLDP